MRRRRRRLSGLSSCVRARTRSAPDGQKLLLRKIIDQLGQVGLGFCEGNIELVADCGCYFALATATIAELPYPCAHTFKGVVAPAGETQQDDRFRAALAEHLRMRAKQLL